MKLFLIWTSGSGGDVISNFFIWSSCSPPVWWSRTICVILKESIMGYICVKLYEIWISY